jgi:hypothetical protein
VSRLSPDGYDLIGPFHPYLVWAAVMLVNLVGIALILTMVLASADWIEDMFWPRDEEFLPF